MITRLDDAFRLTYASPACLDLTGFHPEELVGRPAVEMVQPHDRTWVDETLNFPLQAGKAAARTTYRITRKDLIWLDATEGVGRGRYRPLWTEATDKAGIRLPCVTYIAKGEDADGRPSLRYITLLRDGARAHELPQEWIAFLDRIEPAE